MLSKLEHSLPMQNKVLVDTEDDILSLRKSTSPESSAQRSYPIFRIYYQTDVNKPKLPATAIPLNHPIDPERNQDYGPCFGSLLPA